MGSLPFPNAPHAAVPTFIQRRDLQVTSGNSVTVTFPSPNTAGNLIVAYVVWDNSGSVSLSDTRGNAYVGAIGPTKYSGDRTNAQIFYAKNIAGGTNTVKATFATAITAWGILYIHEYSGVDQVSPLGAAVAASGSSSSMNSGNLAVSTANTLLFAGGESNMAITRAGSGYTARSMGYGNITEDRIASTAGSYSATATQNGNAWVMQLIAFKAATGAPDTTPPSTPANVQASGITSATVTLSWTASTDNVGVAGYKVNRDGYQIATTTQTSFLDTNLTPSTTYAYTVAAYDSPGNVSATSSPALTVTTTPGSILPAYPLKVTANGYLVDQNNKPFLITGDSPQGLIIHLSPSEANTFFANRAEYGFNAMWIHLLAASTFGGSSDGSTYDSIMPFTTLGDLATPNESYFSRVDAILNIAASYGITVFLNPAETIDWLSVLKSNGPDKCRSYGQYLGDRYKNFDNIVWFYGNDFQTWSDPDDDAVVLALSDGIKDSDTRHIHTIELNYSSSGSRDDSNWESRINLSCAYTYYPTYAKVLDEYNRTPVMPVFLGEANYEGESLQGYLTTPNVVRRQAYWAMTSGATGTFYGNYWTWPFRPGWQSNLDTFGSIQMGYVRSLFETRAWYNLVPDQNHIVVIAGYGTFSTTDEIPNNDYLTASYTADGTLVMAYIPTLRTITVDMSRLAAPANGQWYDPSNGTFVLISGSQFANTGTHQFTPPGLNSEGSDDWVLVLETASVPADTEAPSVPSELSATSVSSSQIGISWAPSNDNVGVAGYKIFRDGTFLNTTPLASYTDTGLLPLTTYSYSIVAYDFSNNESAQSSVLVVTTAAVPASPPAFVQQNYATPQSPQSLVSATYAGAQTAGNTNIIAVGWNDTTSSITSLIDTAGNVYQLALATYRGNGLSQAIYYASKIKAAASGSNQVRVTFDRAAVYVDLRITEYSGLNQTSPLEAGVSATGNSSMANSGFIGTSASSDLLFAAGMTYTTFNTPGAGFTRRVITVPDGDIVEDVIAGPRGSYNATASLSSGRWILQLVAFKAASPTL
jgi:chitodextrinase